MPVISIEKTLAGPQLRARLRDWIGRERFQMDFRLKRLRRGHRGLNMGLSPGLYCGDSMHENAINIAEDVFWFLEPAIKRRCVLYARPFDHWGVTEVLREDWIEILREWGGLKAKLQAARLTPDLEILRSIPKDSRTRFVRDFDRNRIGLSKMIGLLNAWMSSQLSDHEQISVLGI